MTPSTPPGRGAENSGPHQGRRLSGCGESPPSATLAGVNGRSVAVDKVLSDLQGTDRSENLDVESKFKEYKETLQAETGESGKADRQIVLAMLTMLEVTNNPVVAERLGFTSSAIGSGYSTSLAKVMDVIIHTPAPPPWRSKVARDIPVTWQADGRLCRQPGKRRGCPGRYPGSGLQRHLWR